MNTQDFKYQGMAFVFIVIFLYCLFFMVDPTLSLIIISLIFCLLVAKYLLSSILEIKNSNNFWFFNKIGFNVCTNVLFGLVSLAILHSVIYFYIDFLTGYYYVFLIVILASGFIVSFLNSDVHHNIDFRLYKLILTVYLPIYIFSLFNVSFLVNSNILNPYYFFTNLFLNLPLHFMQYIGLLVKEKSFFVLFQFEILFYSFIIIVVILSIWYFPSRISHLKIKNSFNENLNSEVISFYPLLIYISILSILQSINGLTEFLIILIWISSVLSVIVFIIGSQQGNSNQFLKINKNLFLWICLGVFYLYIYPLLYHLSTNFLFLVGMQSSNQVIDMFLFIVSGVVFLFLIRSLEVPIDSINEKTYIRISQFIVLVIIISFLPFLSIKLVLTSIIIFFYSNSIQMITSQMKRNSIPLNQSNIKKNYQSVFPIIVEVSIFYVTYLFI